MSMSRSGTVRANGQELYYEVHGEGAPLVLIMGIGYDSTLWQLAQVPALSQNVAGGDLRQPGCRPELERPRPLHRF